MRKYCVSIGLFLIILMINFSGCIDNTTDESVKFTIISLSIEPSIITKGDKAILSWEVLNADSVIINNGIGSVEIEGSRTLYPHESNSYQLNAMNDTTILISRVELTVIENINNSMDFERDVNITPSMTITKDESFNNIRIVKIEDGVEWEYINITATDGLNNYYYLNSKRYVQQGNTIYFDGNGLSGFITIRIWYIPMNKLISEHTLNGVIP